MITRLWLIPRAPPKACGSPRRRRGPCSPILPPPNRPIALDELARAAGAGEIPESSVAVTFDDGRFDGLETISPLLLELGIPATFFVNSERLNEEHES
jgi:peptidoglycan/xylan/chitin deacetylase (PgdA/CDA1 family)